MVPYPMMKVDYNDESWLHRSTDSNIIYSQCKGNEKTFCLLVEYIVLQWIQIELRMGVDRHTDEWTDIQTSGNPWMEVKVIVHARNIVRSTVAKNTVRYQTI